VHSERRRRVEQTRADSQWQWQRWGQRTQHHRKRRRGTAIDRIDHGRIADAARTREDLLTIRDPTQDPPKLEIPVHGSKERVDGENPIGRLSPRFHGTRDNHIDRKEERHNHQQQKEQSLLGGFSEENPHLKPDRGNGKGSHSVAPVGNTTGGQIRRV